MADVKEVSQIMSVSLYVREVWSYCTHAGQFFILHTLPIHDEVGSNIALGGLITDEVGDKPLN